MEQNIQRTEQVGTENKLPTKTKIAAGLLVISGLFFAIIGIKDAIITPKFEAESGLTQIFGIAIFIFSLPIFIPGFLLLTIKKRIYWKQTIFVVIFLSLGYLLVTLGSILDYPVQVIPVIFLILILLLLFLDRNFWKVAR